MMFVFCGFPTSLRPSLQLHQLRDAARCAERGDIERLVDLSPSTPGAPVAAFAGMRREASERGHAAAAERAEFRQIAEKRGQHRGSDPGTAEGSRAWWLGVGVIAMRAAISRSRCAIGLLRMAVMAGISAKIAGVGRCGD